MPRFFLESIKCNQARSFVVNLTFYVIITHNINKNIAARQSLNVFLLDMKNFA